MTKTLDDMFEEQFLKPPTPLSDWALGTFQTCPRKYLKLVIQRKPTVSGPAASSGITWHKMMEAYWPAADKAAAMVLAGEDHILQAMFDRYVEAYPDPVFQLEQEAKFEVDGWKGRIDALWNYRGQRVVVEHKTTSLDIDTFIQLRTFDRQTLLYFAVTGADAVLLDIVSRPKHKTYDGAYKAVTCTRQLIYKTQADIDAFLADTEALRATMDLYCDRDYYPRNPGACLQYNTLCPFFSECANNV